MTSNQLDWIENALSREERLEMEVKKLSDQCEKIRKGQYAKIGKLTKLCDQLRYELDHITHHICKKD